MDCPNDRYVNDADICQAVVGMLARIGVKVNLLAQPKAQYFAKVLKPGGFNTSFYLHAKIIIADGVAHVGSENMSVTSLTKNREVGAFVFEPLTEMKIQAQFDSDWSGATKP